MKSTLTATILLTISFSAFAEVDFSCKSDCMSRYSSEYCDEVCSYGSKDTTRSGGYKPDGALGAYNKGAQDADREMQNQQELILKALAIRAEMQRQKQLEDRIEQERATSRGVELERQKQLDQEREKALQAERERRKQLAESPERAGKSDIQQQKLRAPYDVGLKKPFNDQPDSALPSATTPNIPKSTKNQSARAFERAVLAYKTHDFETAFSDAVKAAEAGHSGAQNLVGFMYMNGEGVTQNPDVAVSWLRKASEQGQLDAQYNLSRAYFSGYGVDRDQSIAMRWLNSAAAGGNPPAQYRLGLFYLVGQMDLAKDESMAVFWLRKSAMQGYKRAQNQLTSLGKNWP